MTNMTNLVQAQLEDGSWYTFESCYGSRLCALPAEDGVNFVVTDTWEPPLPQKPDASEESRAIQPTSVVPHSSHLTGSSKSSDPTFCQFLVKHLQGSNVIELHTIHGKVPFAVC